MDPSLAKIGLANVSYFSDKTRNAATKLINYLKLESVHIPNELLSYLHLIEEGELFEDYPEALPKVRINSTQKRKYTVFQICGVGSSELMPSQSIKGRFFPEIVMNILSLLGYETDRRTVELIMKKFDVENKRNLSAEELDIVKFGLYSHNQWELIDITYGL